MAYAALISIKHTIERLIHSSRISILPPSPEIKVAYDELWSLEAFVKRKLDPDLEKVNALDTQLREAICKFEDVLEFNVSGQLLSQSESFGDESYQLNLQEVELDINSFTETVKRIKKEYSIVVLQLSNPLLDDDDDDDDVSLGIYFVGNNNSNSKMVGLSDELVKIKDLLIKGWWSSTTVSIVGMAGIGKTVLAKQVYDDPFISNHFRCRVWVTIGTKYRPRKIMLAILDQINRKTDKECLKNDDELAKSLIKSLNGKRYLIVLDDVWNTKVCDELISLLREGGSEGSRILLTTRLEEVARSACSWYGVVHKMRFLNKEESWYMFRKKVFGEDLLCPTELEKDGKKIAENCQGLPLAIIAVANLLSKAEKTPEYWNKVAENENLFVFDANDEISKVLFLSYKELPQHLKACFLYMAVFPPNYEIPTSKLIKLWSAEGFLQPDSFTNSEYSGFEYLDQLVSNSLILVRKQSSNCKIKTFGIHYVFRHLCISEARKDKFLHVINSYANGVTQGIKNQRRLCIHKNVLFGIKDVYNSMASISTPRSVLCTGPHHQYPVPMCFGLSLLRVLNALTIRFYNFPFEILKLVQLRYLAFTYNGKLPASISKLWNLQHLIVRPHLSIKHSGAPLYLPREIWNMQELRHLQVMGSDLPDPPYDVLLEKLLTLLDVSTHSCNKKVLERIPNLKKLGILIELQLDAAETLRCFDHLAHLQGLESVKCVIVNPIPCSRIVVPNASSAIFPSGLKKLSLSGLGYPWDFMSKIAALQNLEVLKLRCNAFQGSKWKVVGSDFPRLKFLLLEDIDLVHWEIAHRFQLLQRHKRDDGYESPLLTHHQRGYPYKFPLLQHSKRFHDYDSSSLQSLIIRHCYKLKEIPMAIGDIWTLKMIEVVDCKPSVVASAKQILERRQSDHRSFSLHVHSSLDDKKSKS